MEGWEVRTWTHPEPVLEKSNNELGSYFRLAYVKCLAINRCVLLAGPANHLGIGCSKGLQPPRCCLLGSMGHRDGCDSALWRMNKADMADCGCLLYVGLQASASLIEDSDVILSCGNCTERDPCMPSRALELHNARPTLDVLISLSILDAM